MLFNFFNFSSDSVSLPNVILFAVVVENVRAPPAAYTVPLLIFPVIE